MPWQDQFSHCLSSHHNFKKQTLHDNSTSLVLSIPVTYLPDNMLMSLESNCPTWSSSTTCDDMWLKQLIILVLVHYFHIQYFIKLKYFGSNSQSNCWPMGHQKPKPDLWWPMGIDIPIAQLTSTCEFAWLMTSLTFGPAS